MALPKKNTLWSRKDSRRPGVVRVLSIVTRSKPWGGRWRYVKWQSIDTPRTGEVQVEQWERRYRPFEAPTEGTATTGGEK
jgi:hypothetical protein